MPIHVAWEDLEDVPLGSSGAARWGVDSAVPASPPQSTSRAAYAAVGELDFPDRTGPGGPRDRTGVWINIHAGPPDQSPEDNWSKLEEIMGWATLFRHRLTVLFMPEWLEHLLSSSSARDDVADWLADGHRIGFHHHEVEHSVGRLWDGYHSLPVGVCTDYQSYAECMYVFARTPAGFVARPRHPVSDAFGLLEELKETLQREHGVGDEAFEDGFAANHGKITAFRDYEWQAGAVFSQGKQEENLPCTTPASDLGKPSALSSPSCASYRGYDVPEIGGAHFAVGTASGVNRDQVLTELSSAQPREYVGVTFHPWEFTSTYPDETTYVGWASDILALFADL